MTERARLVSYLNNIWPLFVAEKELRDELNALSGQGRLGSHDFGLDVQRLICMLVFLSVIENIVLLCPSF